MKKIFPFLLVFINFCACTQKEASSDKGVKIKIVSKWDILHGQPYNFVDEMPSFPGGDQERVKFIMDNIVYPSEDKENGIMGTVYITFIVEKDGTLSDIKILRGIGGGCDNECLRVVKLMPKWNPGKLNGKAVRVVFYLPLKFEIV